MPSRPRLGVRVVAFVLGGLLVAGAGLAGWRAWITRPQGEAQAVEFAEGSLSAELSGARVLALGEATHGNAEFQQLRLQLIQKLPGFRAIVLEEDFGRVALANRYVQGEPGTSQQAARQLGFVLNHTEEMAELLRWLRDHNAGLPVGERVELIGMDVQRVDANKEISLSWLGSRDPELAESLRKELGGWTDASSTGGVVDARPAVDRLIAALDDAPEADGRVARNAAIALRQHLDLLDASNHQYAALRAKIMAANLERTVTEQAARGNGHTVLFAHNSHVDKESKAFAHDDLGTLAARRWGDGYRAIGTEYHHNTLRTGERERRWTVKINNPTPLRGIFAGTAVGWLEFSTASGTNMAVLERSVSMGSAGEGFKQWQAVVPWLNSVSMVPARSYDALVLVEEATPVTPLS